MSDQAEAHNDGGKNSTLTWSFNKKAFEALKKVGRDVAISAVFNGAVALGQHFNLSDNFFLFAYGTGITAAGITAGRYMGGAAGSLVDAATHRSDGRYRKAAAAIGGTVVGGTAFLGYQGFVFAMTGSNVH